MSCLSALSPQAFHVEATVSLDPAGGPGTSTWWSTSSESGQTAWTSGTAGHSRRNQSLHLRRGGSPVADINSGGWRSMTHFVHTPFTILRRLQLRTPRGHHRYPWPPRIPTAPNGW